MANISIPCPFSPARLHELYWLEFQSMAAIARREAVSDAVVRRWLVEAGITLRTRSEVIRAEYVTHGVTKREAVRQTARRINAELAPTRSAEHLHTRRVAQKIGAAQKARLAKRREAILVTTVCAYCRVEMRLLPSRVKERNYCCRTHLMRFRWQEARRA